jgi:hypothetical protein
LDNPIVYQPLAAAVLDLHLKERSGRRPDESGMTHFVTPGHTHAGTHICRTLDTSCRTQRKALLLFFQAKKEKPSMKQLLITKSRQIELHEIQRSRINDDLLIGKALSLSKCCGAGS